MNTKLHALSIALFGLLYKSICYNINKTHITKTGWKKNYKTDDDFYNELSYQLHNIHHAMQALKTCS